jgi:hypothetical protein
MQHFEIARLAGLHVHRSRQLMVLHRPIRLLVAEIAAVQLFLQIGCRSFHLDRSQVTIPSHEL